MTDSAPIPAPADSLPTRDRPQVIAELGRRLVAAQRLTEKQLGECLLDAERRKLPMERLLAADRMLPESEVLRMLSEITQYPLVHIPETSIAEEAVACVPARVVAEFRVIPLQLTEEAVTLAADRIHNLEVDDDLRILIGRSIRWALCTAQEVSECIKHYYGVGVETFLGLHRGGPGGGAKADADAGPDMSAFVQHVVADAIACRATDIHFEPGEDRLRLRYRIDGILYPIALPKGADAYHRAIASSTKVIAQLNIAERRLPQDGRFSVTAGGESFDLRVSILPTPHGESVNLRILNRQATFLNLDELGLPAEQRAALESLIELPHGIVLFTGPTGSGKTTSLYASLARLNDTQRKIITIEDPVEYRIDGITQLQVNDEIGFGFATGLRSILRHDPDVVLIGEIRDRATADIAISAALTGHMVFSTLHTNDSASALTRLVNMGMEPYLVSSSVQGVVAQRLLRHICEACRYKLPSHPELWEQIRREMPEPFAPRPLYAGRGCPACRFTGYVGRSAIFEILVMRDVLRAMVVTRRPSTEIMQRAVADGLHTLRQSGWLQVLAGSATADDVLRMTQTPAAPGGKTGDPP
jgi:type II secretory ATPase GspE/PulE/Tfp pilus assembly ATPase PilB-like protein